MAADGALTEWARLEVQRMIDATIERYDIKQEKRHQENTQKLDRNADAVSSLKDSMSSQFGTIRDAISKSQGVKDYKAYILPSLLTAGLVIIGIIDLFKR